MKQTSQVGVTLEIEPHAKPRRAIVSDDPAFRILVLADLGGEMANAGRPVRIDRDDFDVVLESIAPRAVLGMTDGGAPVIARFTDIDDFHPDHIRTTLPLFRQLRALRDRLDDPRTFEAAARELVEGTDREGDDVASDTDAESAIDPAQPAPSGGNGGRGAGSGSLLDRMLDETAGPSPLTGPGSAGGSSRPPLDDLQAFIREAVAPHIVPGEDPRRGPLVERLDAAAGELMRRVLHDPAFRSVESAWRSLFRMTREIETGQRLTIDVVDMPRAQLEADLAADGPVERSTLHRVMVDEPSEPWSVVIADYAFDTGDDDVALLGRIAEVAYAAGVSVIAMAEPSVCGCPAFEGLPDPADWAAIEADAWRTFRRGPTARHIGLVQPRLLGRLPYGGAGQGTETFEFEEMSDPPLHDEYLWSGGAYACAVLLARSFTADGAAMRPGTHLDLDGLPLHLVRSGGTTEAQPCAESLMSDRAAARILECGPMALASMKGSDAVRLVRFQSVAEPAAPLAGPWTL
jgi:type VI secretion system protein ImpC